MGVEGSILVLVLVLVLVFLLVMGVVVKGTILRDLKTFIDDGYYKSQRERERELCISISTDYLNLYFYIWKEKEKVLLGFWGSLVWDWEKQQTLLIYAVAISRQSVYNNNNNN